MMFNWQVIHQAEKCRFICLFRAIRRAQIHRMCSNLILLSFFHLLFPLEDVHGFTTTVSVIKAVCVFFLPWFSFLTSDEHDLQWRPPLSDNLCFWNEIKWKESAITVITLCVMVSHNFMCDGYGGEEKKIVQIKNQTVSAKSPSSRFTLSRLQRDHFFVLSIVDF